MEHQYNIRRILLDSERGYVTAVRLYPGAYNLLRDDGSVMYANKSGEFVRYLILQESAYHLKELSAVLYQQLLVLSKEVDQPLLKKPL